MSRFLQTVNSDTEVFQRISDLRHSSDVKFVLEMVRKAKKTLQVSLLAEARKPVPDKDLMCMQGIRIELLDDLLSLSDEAQKRVNRSRS